MLIERQKALNIIVNAIRTVGEQSTGHKKELDRLELREDVILSGDGAIVDSIELVLIVINVEEELSKQFNREILLTNDESILQERNVFKSVKSLVDYICSLDI